jgi:nucleoside-triphosphatase THEP1
MTMAHDDPILAALVYPTGEGAVMGRLAEAALGLGLDVAGMIQHDERRPDRRRCDMTLVDLGSGRKIPLSEDRGKDTRGCRMDHAALEEAAGLALATLEADTLPDLLVLSKFGKREIEGHGFRQVVERAVELGVPLLVGVTADHVEGFRAFGGGLEQVVETAEAAAALIEDLARTKAARDAA